MDSFFQRLTDLGLKRIYKFVLKSTLGKYLDDELLIEQLDVRSRDGVIVLKGLRLRAEALNDELQHIAPLRVVTALIDEIQVHLSYSTLLTESCRFVLNTVDLSVEPSVLAAKPSPEGDPSPEGPAAEAAAEAEAAGSDGQESLGHMAYWVQVIIAKLQVTVNKLCLHARISAGMPGLTVTFLGMTYFNTDPMSFEGRSSSIALSNSTLPLTGLGATKVLRCAGIQVTLDGPNAEDGGQDPLLSLSGGLQAKLSVTGGLSIDADLPVVKLALNNAVLQALVQFAGQWVSGRRTDALHALQAVDLSTVLKQVEAHQRKNLQRLEMQLKASKTDGEMGDQDLLAIVHFMQSSRGGRPPGPPAPSGPSGAPGHVPVMEQVLVDDEDDFPASNPASEDEDDDEDGFFDAMGGTKSSLRREKTSGMHRSSLYSSALPAPAAASGGAGGAPISMEVRLRIGSLSVRYTLLDGSKALVLEVQDAILSLTKSKLHLSLTQVSLSEDQQGQERGKQVLIAFKPVTTGRVIYSSPHIAIDLAIDTMSMAVVLEPMVVGFSPKQAAVWTESLSALSLSTGDTSTTTMALSVQLAAVHLYVHADCNELSTWERFQDALRLDVVQEHWHAVDQVPGPLQAGGGLILTCQGLALVMDETRHCVEMDSAMFSIFLAVGQRGHRYLAANLISATGSANEKMRIVRSNASIPNSSMGNSKAHELGPSPPMVESSRVVFISAYHLQADIHQREYNALMMIADVLVDAKPSSRAQEPTGSAGGGSAFGLQISTAYATISLGENEHDLIAAIAAKGHVKKPFDQLACLLQQLRTTVPPMPPAAPDVDASAVDALPAPPAVPVSPVLPLMKLVISIRRPIFDLLCVDGELFVSLKANDLSIFEMSPADHRALVREGFDFNLTNNPTLRAGSSLAMASVPIIHQRRGGSAGGGGSGGGGGARSGTTSSARTSSSAAAAATSVSLLGDHASYGYAFEVRLALYQGNAKEVQLFVDFFDILWNHDPSSPWLLQLVAFLTPLTAQEILEIAVEAVAEEIQSMRVRWEQDEGLVEKITVLCAQLLQEDKEDGAEVRGSQDPSSPIASTASSAPSSGAFEMTKILVRVRESVIQYLDPTHEACALLSVGLLTLYSTIVSDSSRFNLKIALKDISMAMAPCKEVWEHQRLGKGEELAFAQVLEVDHVTVTVRIQEHDHEALGLAIALGGCMLHGCVDSLLLLQQALGRWFVDFQTACNLAEVILKKKKTSQDLDHRDYEDQGVDRVRTVLGDALQGDGLREGLLLGDKGGVAEPRVLPDPRVSSDPPRQTPSPMEQPDQDQGEGMGALIVEDHFYSTSEEVQQLLAASTASSEVHAHWLPDYELDAEDADGFDLEDFLATSEEVLEEDEEELESRFRDQPRFRDEDRFRDQDSMLSTTTSVADAEEAVAAPPQGSKGVFSFWTSTPEEVQQDDIELQSMHSRSRSSTSSEVQEEVEVAATTEEVPGVYLTNGEAADSDIDRAWSQSQAPAEDEATAHWYEDTPQEVLGNYIPAQGTSSRASDTRPAQERNLSLALALSLTVSHLTVRLYAGKEWEEMIMVAAPLGECASGSQMPPSLSQAKGSQIPPPPISKGRQMPPSSTAGKGGAPHSSMHSSSSSARRSVKFASKPLFADDPLLSPVLPMPSAPSTSASVSSAPAASAPIPSTSTSSSNTMTSISRSSTFLELTARDCALTVFTYTPLPSTSEEVPNDRITLSLHDWLLTFGADKPTRRKLLGIWQSPSLPRDTSVPALAVILCGYRSRESVEYRLTVKVLPLRAFLSAEFVAFVKSLLPSPPPPTPTAADAAPDGPLGTPSASSGASSSTPSGVYLQFVEIQGTEIKLDYRPSHVNLKALRQGDFLQLLNVLPIDGMELSLRTLRFKGITSNTLGQRIAEAYVRDIYSTQLHRLLTGAAPLRGLYNVGNDLQTLLFLPDRRDLVHKLAKRTSTLIKTVARESLDLGHKVTQFVANTITDLASEDHTSSSNGGNGGRRDGERLRDGGRERERRQPKGVSEGLSRAYTTIKHEMHDAAETVVAVPIRQYEQLGPGGIVTEVVRALPVAILKPLAGIATGLSYTILGLRNDIDPGRKADEEDVYTVDLL